MYIWYWEFKQLLKLYVDRREGCNMVQWLKFLCNLNVKQMHKFLVIHISNKGFCSLCFCFQSPSKSMVTPNGLEKSSQVSYCKVLSSDLKVKVNSQTFIRNSRYIRKTTTKKNRLEMIWWSFVWCEEINKITYVLVIKDNSINN